MNPIRLVLQIAAASHFERVTTISGFLLEVISIS